MSESASGAVSMVQDLASSGLTPKDLDSRPIDSPERSVTAVPSAVDGYVIPYFRMNGNRLGFYRVKLFDYLPKYKQPKNNPNHIYYPPTFRQTLTTHLAKGPKHQYVILTEGEKKAAALTKLGLPTIAVSGVDSWRNRTMNLPAGTELLPGKKEGTIVAKLQEGAEIEDAEHAVGFQEFITLLVDKKLTVIIIFDTTDLNKEVGEDKEKENRAKSAHNVQRAAAHLGYEFRHLGIPTQRIRQLILPPVPNKTGKTGIDDYLEHKEGGAERFQFLIDATLTARMAFPRHPNVKDYVNKKLQSNRLSRKDSQKVAISILTELDATGVRLKNGDSGQLYYFDSQSKLLTRISIAMFERELVDTGPFGNMLFDRYGLGKQDRAVMGWLAQLISTEPPLNIATPRRILYADRHKNAVNFQINDGQYIHITSNKDDPAKVLDNGTDNMLFEAGHVSGIDAQDLHEEVELQRKDWADTTPDARHPAWWYHVLMDTRLKNKDDIRHVRILTLLYYLSPWLNRWKNTQLPVELLVGESGSGKSTLLSLRLSILLGRPFLRNAPTDIKDWHSSISSSGGLHVTDNVQFADKALRQRLSDEICRIVTEPDPHIEMRRLYTTAELARFPIDCVFAFTAITQPFPNADLINRSLLLELEKTTSGGNNQNGNTQQKLPAQEPIGDDYVGIEYGSAWESNHLHHNGRYPTTERARAAWIAHHAFFLSHLFRLIEGSWNWNYSARHRLINFEQLMIFGARVFGWKEQGGYSWVSNFLASAHKKIISETDWALEGLSVWAQMQRELGQGKHLQKKWTAGDIVAWCEGNEEYKDCQQLVNVRRLGRYIVQHKALVEETTGISLVGTKQGANTFMLLR